LIELKYSEKEQKFVLKNEPLLNQRSGGNYITPVAKIKRFGGKFRMKEGIQVFDPILSQYWSPD